MKGTLISLFLLVTTVTSLYIFFDLVFFYGEPFRQLVTRAGLSIASKELATLIIKFIGGGEGCLLVLVIAHALRLLANALFFGNFMMPDGSAGEPSAGRDSGERSSASEDSFELQVLSEPWPITHNIALEASIRTRILRLENEDSIFLLDKEKREYWNDIKTALDQAPSQREYNQLLEFENRDLQIRERKHSCYSLFQLVLSENPVLGENATYTYNSMELFSDFLNEKRDALDAQGGNLLMRDSRELDFLNEMRHDLQRNGRNSEYIRKILSGA